VRQCDGKCRRIGNGNMRVYLGRGDWGEVVQTHRTRWDRHVLLLSK